MMEIMGEEAKADDVGRRGSFLSPSIFTDTDLSALCHPRISGVNQHGLMSSSKNILLDSIGTF